MRILTIFIEIKILLFDANAKSVNFIVFASYRYIISISKASHRDRWVTANNVQKCLANFLLSIDLQHLVYKWK